MSKKYINDKNDRDIAWFNLDNYRYIEEQPEQEVIIEFDTRKKLLLGKSVDFGVADSLEVLGDLDKESVEKNFISRVFAGKPSSLSYIAEINHASDEVDKMLLRKLENSSDSPMLSCLAKASEKLKPVSKVWLASVLDVICYYGSLKRKGLANDCVDSFTDEIKGYLSARDLGKESEVALLGRVNKSFGHLSNLVDGGSMSFSEVRKEGDRVLCNVDLASFSDAELVAHFQKSLVEWRELLGVPEPERKMSTPGVVGKLKEFRIIPLLDLLIWELGNNARIKKSILAGLLFPDNENGNSELESGKGKVMRFLNKVMAPNFDFKDE